MTELEQTLTGENKVLRDLLKTTCPVLQLVRDESEYGEREMLDDLIDQIDSALTAAPVDLFGG